MNAAEVIEQIKEMPRGELARIFAFVHQYEKEFSETAPGSDQSAREAGEWVIQNYGELLRKLAR